MPFHNGRWDWDNDIGILMAMGATPLKWPKVNRDDEAKLSDLKKNHAFERQVKTDRHHNDAERLKKVKQASPVTCDSGVLRSSLPLQRP